MLTPTHPDAFKKLGGDQGARGKVLALLEVSFWGGLGCGLVLS